MYKLWILEFYEGNWKKNQLSQTYIEFDGCNSNVKSEKRNFMGLLLSACIFLA